ncbi:MAG: DUF3791 domain-containing protein [Bacteroidales bacterium]|nr:DUF3791 domain-containing protein [Bacteroidales bacterium]
MRDNVLWRKQASIIMLLSDVLHIDTTAALDIFYSTETYKNLSNPATGLQLMSDKYIVQDILDEIKKD